MKAKVFPIIFTAILILFACKKEKASGDIEIEITHWPVVKTLDVANLTLTTVTLNGTVNGYGLSTIVTFEYDTNTDIYDIPTSYSNTVVASQSPVTESGIIYVSADISGLTVCPIYHFRIKAENSLWKNFYGSDQHFYIDRHPTVTTTPASDITATNAIVGGDITSDGGSAITERGLAWAPSTVKNPRGFRQLKDDSTGVGRFTCYLSGSEPNTSYVVISYVRNCLTTRFIGVMNSVTGNAIEFTTSPLPKDLLKKTKFNK